MKFSGPTHDGVDWDSSDTLEITYETADELQKNREKYLNARRALVRTSAKAQPGDVKSLVFHLPGGDSFSTRGKVEKVKEQPGKPFALALFALAKLDDEVIAKLDAALRPADADDLDFGEAFDMPLTNDFEPEPEKPRQAVPASAPKANPSTRSKEDEQALQAYLSDDTPDDFDITDAELPEELKGASGDLIMPKKEGEEVDPHLEDKKYIIAFVLTFTKSVQRTGYYGDANHPEAIKAKKGLYTLFRRIIGRRREVSFIRKAIGKDRDVLIDGVLEDMVTLREIMPHGMADLYIPRFLEYLERRCLISFSIKRIINEEKFNAFIGLLSQYSPEFREDSRKEGERFTKTLVENGIMEVSAIFDEDIIASGRKLPWQAELTLSRLKKDLKTVPLLRNATEEELRQIKVRIFQDVIRPLRNPSFMIAVLLNADLIMESIEDQSALKDIDVEAFMITGAEIGFLAQTSREMIKEINGVRELQIKAPLETQRANAAKQEKILMRLFAHITDRFQEESRNAEMDDALEEFYNNKLIAFKTLPIRIQERITNKKLMEAMQKNADEILDRFNGPLSEKEFSDFINRFQRVIPLLAEKGEYMLVSKIIDSARKHLDDRDVRRRSLTKRLFDYISSTNILETLKEAFNSDDKQLRDLSLAVFISFGRQSVPMLLDLLKTHEDKWVRKQLIRALMDIGPAGVQPMINELYKKGNPWYFLRNIINILGEIGDRRIAGKLNLLLFNEHPQVREETIMAIYRISPDTAETHVVKALEDQDPRVREKAIYCLGMLGSVNERVMQFYMDVLEGRVALDNEALQIQVYNAIGQLGHMEEARRRTIENLLVNKLEVTYGGGWKALFKSATQVKLSDGVKMAICQALGTIGKGKKVRAVLIKASKEHDPVLSQRAKQALGAVKARPD
jgi:HEAT repeat protein